ncbi:L,D-transpeptidase family protein [Desulfovibrio sp. OttesenSCG-928-O18]|nr:L,D-transpeptidase family protein [Desulfovibrio sp. OttesenSCG-928-O18]
MRRYPIRCRILCSFIAVAMVCVFASAAFAASSAGAMKTDAATATGTPSGWHARITGNDASPQRLVAVDKKQQTLFLFERHSPLRLAGKFSCTTGQNAGDKFVEGDLKTPEGVYFVIRRLSSGLNYEKYGYEAYTLNYPNPVDKLRKKTGYGIWIHGRGVPITPNLTEGCVSLNNTDIAMLGKNLTPGTPVALADGVSFAPAPSAEDLAVIAQLHKKTYGWAKAWSSRSKKFFDYYDPEAYAIAQGENFTAFRQQKERVFKSVKWIDTKVSNVQALQGPGYWVTWFQQDYRASNLSSKGVRRLYWQKDKKGDLRIVGMEWAPHLYGTLTAGLGESFVPSAAPLTVAAAPEPRPVALAVAAPHAVPAAPAQPAAPVAPVVAEAPARPAPVQEAPPAPSAVPPTVPPVAEAPTPSVEKPAAQPVAEPVAVALAEPAKTAPEPAPQPQMPKITDVPAFVERWRTVWEKGNLEAYAACYAKDAVQGSRSGRAAIRSHKRGLWRKSSPKQVLLTNVRITTKQNTVVVDMHQSYTDSKSFADMGVKTLYLQAKGNTWQILREDWSPMQQ